VRRFLLALLLPEAGEADGGAEFPRFGLLLLRELNGCEETGCGVRLGLGSGNRERGTANGELAERQLAFQPIHFRLVPMLPSFAYYLQRLGQYDKSFLCLSHFPIRLGQHGQSIRPA
jgi:hypothetical protein